MGTHRLLLRCVAGSFFGLLEAETGSTGWDSQEQARSDVSRFIEIDYNRTGLRHHPDFGYLTPVETRHLLHQDLAPAA